MKARDETSSRPHRAIARLLGVALPDVEGRVLEQILIETK
jgi:hypothetical protein